MSYILQLDSDLLILINSLHSHILDPMVRTFSGKTIWIALYVAIAATIIWRLGWKRGLVTVGAIAMAVGLSDLICGSLIRPLVGRLRPSNPLNDISALIHLVGNYRGGGFGFPSCHATNSVALAVFSSLVLRSRPYTLFISLWATLQCYSRLYLGVHYPGDILVGALIGAGVAYACYWVARTYIDYGTYNSRATTVPVIALGCLLILSIPLACML